MGFTNPFQMANYYRCFSKLLTAASGVGSGVLIVYYGLLQNDKNKVYASANTTSQPQRHGIAVHKWDSNWDR